MTGQEPVVREKCDGCGKFSFQVIPMEEEERNLCPRCHWEWCEYTTYRDSRDY
jgi:uncharacterized paraquat-inducible protein A